MLSETFYACTILTFISFTTFTIKKQYYFYFLILKKCSVTVHLQYCISFVSTAQKTTSEKTVVEDYFIIYQDMWGKGYKTVHQLIYF